MKKQFRKIKNMAAFYVDKRISRSSAALSYYITLSLFPFLICLNALLANTNITVLELLEDAQRIIPTETADFIRRYLEYISENDSPILLTSAIVLMITTAAAGYRVLMHSISDITGDSERKGLYNLLMSFILPVGFLATILLSIVVMLTGQRLFELLHYTENIALFSVVWRRVRFVIMFLLLYLLISGIYSAATSERKVRGYILNRAAFYTSAVIVATSIVFSVAIEMTSRYTVVYGSIASVIVLMLWLYFCSNILIIGSSLCGKRCGDKTE